MSTINYTYNVLVDRFRQFADGHFQLRRFTHGEISQADLEKEAEWPWLHVKPRAINYSPGTRSFSFEIFISDLPRDKEDKTGYQAESITDCSLIFQDLINEIYLGNMFGSDVVLTRPVNSEPFVEQYTHTLTGVTGIIELNLDYDWSACSIPASWNYNTPTDSPSEANNYLTFIDSITQQGFNVSLVNDVEAPGNSYYYGTNASGVKGWHVLEAGGLTCEDLPDCATIISILDDIAALQADVALKANTADLGATAFSNDYNDLDNLPNIPAAQVNSDWNATSGPAQILNKPTIPSISGLATVTYVDQQDALKVDKVAGKGLSTEDYTTAEKNKLAGIQAGAEVNVNADWNAVSGDAQILNKPTLTNGTVTSVGITAGTGISVSGSPVTSSGSITVTNSAPDQVVALTAGSGIAVTGTYPNFTITNNAPSGGTVTDVTATAPMSSTGGATPNLSMTSANGTTNGYLLSSDWLIFNGKFNTPTGTTLQYLRGDGSLATFPAIPAQYNPTAGTGISITGSYPNQTITNTAPDQTVSLTAGTNIGVTGTYPNFTINNTQSLAGLVSNTRTITINGTAQDLSADRSYTIDKASVGLSNVDNTSDANKPISTATQTALNAKQDTLTLTTTGTSGAATLVGSTLNIPQYSGGGGASSGTHAPFELGSGKIYSNIPIGASNATAPFSTANLILIMPFKPAQTFTTSNIFVNVSVLGAGVNARILLYSHSATNGLPDTKIYESANLDCSTTGVKTATTAQTFTAGTTYWLGVHASGIVTLAGVVVSSLIQIGVESTLAQYTAISRGITFGSAPSTWGTIGNPISSSFPRIGLTIA